MLSFVLDDNLCLFSMQALRNALCNEIRRERKSVFDCYVLFMYEYII